MSLSTSYGLWYRLEPDGRFMPLSQAAGESDGVCCVINPADSENVTTQAMNAAATIPAGSRRWVVDGQALQQAFLGGTKLALTPA